MSDPWTYVPFQLGWQSVTFGGFRWYDADLAQPPNFGITAGTTVQFFVGIIGVGLQGSFTGDLTEDSTSITSCADGGGFRSRFGLLSDVLFGTGGH